MRTTVTLDPDVAARLKAEAKARDISFKEALNSSVRLGLESKESTASKPYRAPTKVLGAKQGIDLDKALHVADRLEDTEVVRKLALRK